VRPAGQTAPLWALCDSGVARLEGMRRAPVSGFAAYLVFQAPRASGIDVVRALHGARDIENLFAGEEGQLKPFPGKVCGSAL